MNTVAQDASDYLVAQGVGAFAATSGWSIHIDFLPDTPDTCIALMTQLGGQGENLISPSGKLYDNALQVLVRDRDITTAMEKAEEVVSTLEEMEGTTVEGVRYAVVDRTTDIARVSYDERRRMLVSGNMRIRRG